MNAVKYNKGGKLKVSSATKSVPAPSGFHWMVDRGRYFLLPYERRLQTTSWRC
jgi:hypothetical protein